MLSSIGDGEYVLVGTGEYDLVDGAGEKER